MKDEVSGNAICGYVGLRQKMYSIITTDGEKKKKAKGVKKQYWKMKLSIKIT